MEWGRSDSTDLLLKLGQRAQTCGLSHQLRSVRPMKEWSSTPFTGTTLVSLAWITFIESIPHIFSCFAAQILCARSRKWPWSWSRWWWRRGQWMLRMWGVATLQVEIHPDFMTFMTFIGDFPASHVWLRVNLVSWTSVDFSSDQT